MVIPAMNSRRLVALATIALLAPSSEAAIVMSRRLVALATITLLAPSSEAAIDLSTSPAWADVHGGTTVELRSAIPFSSPVAAEARCVFGAVTVPAILLPGKRSLRCTVPASPGGALGTVTVAVNIDPDPEAQGLGEITYYDSTQPPVVSEVRPSTSDGARPQTVRVLGSNFAPLSRSDAICAFGSDGPTAASFVSPTELTCASPRSALAESHTVDLRVSSDGRRFSAPGAAPFHVRITAAAPRLSHLAPPLGPARGGTEITLTGRGFAPAPGRLQCAFGDLRPTAATFDSSERVRCQAPASHSSAVLSVPLSLVAAGDSPLPSSALPFVYYDPRRPPVVAAVSPAYGDVHTPPSVTLRGDDFAPVGDALTCVFGEQHTVCRAARVPRRRKLTTPHAHHAARATRPRARRTPRARRARAHHAARLGAARRPRPPPTSAPPPSGVRLPRPTPSRSAR